MELGHVLQVLDLRCPQSLERPDPSANLPDKRDSTDIEIDVDAIDPRTFAELDRYVKEKMLSRSNSSGDGGDKLFEANPNSRKKQKRS